MSKSIQVKNVPDEVHDALSRRAAAEGQSLQQYLLARLTRDAQYAPVSEVLQRAATRSDKGIPSEFTVTTLRELRGAE